KGFEPRLVNYNTEGEPYGFAVQETFHTSVESSCGYFFQGNMIQSEMSTINPWKCPMFAVFATNKAAVRISEAPLDLTISTAHLETDNSYFQFKIKIDTLTSLFLRTLSHHPRSVPFFP